MMRKFINNKEDLKVFLDYESKKYGRKNKKSPIFLYAERHYLWKYNLLLRKTEFYVNTNNKFMGGLYKVLLQKYQNKYQIHIPINTFDKGLKLMHLGPVLVNAKVRCGKDVSMHINTALVAGGSSDGTPILDDGVVVGVGAVILGGIHIAKNIAIGANAVVNKSFDEENIAIAGVPAKKVSDKGRSSWGKDSKQKSALCL